MDWSEMDIAMKRYKSALSSQHSVGVVRLTEYSIQILVIDMQHKLMGLVVHYWRWWHGDATVVANGE